MEDLQGLEMAGAQTLPATINGIGGIYKERILLTFEKCICIVNIIQIEEAVIRTIYVYMHTPVYITMTTEKKKP